MTPLAKFLTASFAIALVVAATLALRPRPQVVTVPHLTPAQVAELQPQAQATPAPQPAPAAASVTPPPPPPEDDSADALEPDLEDGSGS